MIKLISEKVEMQRFVKQHKTHDRTIAIVPTMGGLHDGHLALVAQAKAVADIVVVTIYVNPTQFAAGEDLERYPRTLDDDLLALQEQALADCVYMPSNMYRDGHATSIVPSGAALPLEGEYRPQFFTGVATIVLKLFHHIQADFALFGEKDFQQCAVIKQMVKDLDVPISIITCPTKRDYDGLALSSRNRYLTTEERRIAPKLYQIMQALAAELTAGKDVTDAIAHASENLVKAGFTKIDYISLCDPDTLEAVSSKGDVRPETRILVAAFLGQTRLIDNGSIEKLCSAQ